MAVFHGPPSTQVHLTEKGPLEEWLKNPWPKAAETGNPVDIEEATRWLTTRGKKREPEVKEPEFVSEWDLF